MTVVTAIQMGLDRDVRPPKSTVCEWFPLMTATYSWNARCELCPRLNRSHPRVVLEA